MSAFLSFFMNPWTLLAGAALVSTPIIIHLINRMRYRRVRWAAMEFLLKAQKKMRRKKILEQLLLLLLRCLLVFLAGLLFARFLGLNPEEGKETRPVVHVVVLDDTPSMADAGAADAGGDAFTLARAQVTDKIIPAALKATTPQRLRVLRLSDQTDLVNPGADREPALITTTLKDTVQGILAQEKVATVHVPLAAGLKRAKQLLDASSGTGSGAETSKIVHVVSDLRALDWTAEGEAIAQATRELEEAGVKVHLIDVATPFRKRDRKNQTFSENVGILELKPRKRVAALDDAVEFEIRVKNFGITTQSEVMVRFFLNGTQNFIESMLLEPLLPGEERTRGVRVSLRTNEGATVATTENPLGRFNVVSALIKAPANDALAADNVRHAVVEVREKLSVLVVMNQEEYEQSKKDEGPKKDGDSFYLRNLFDTKFSGVQWVSAAADELEKRDLKEFSSIYLLNVPTLKKGEAEQLERYVRDGGGVCMMLGDKVVPGTFDPKDPARSRGYNGLLYRDGEGFFPFPLPAEPTKPLTQEERDKRAFSFTKRVLVRDPAAKSHPALEGIYRDDIIGTKDTAEKVERLFMLAGIFQHWKIERIGRWREDRTIQELYCLPNEASIETFEPKTTALARSVRKSYEAARFTKYRKVLDERLEKIRSLVSDTSNPTLTRLAQALDELLADQFSDADADDALLREFWNDPEVAAARAEAQSVRDSAKFGDPLYVARRFDKGRVAVFTIPAGAAPAGAAWTDWPYGPGSPGWVAVMTECQKYLSGGGVEENRVLGSPLERSFDPTRTMAKGLWRHLNYDVANPNLHTQKVDPTWEPKPEQPAKPIDLENRDGVLRLAFADTKKPGVYLFENAPNTTDAPATGPGARKPEYVAAVYNFDTEREGDLKRASTDDFSAAAKSAQVHAADEDWAERLEQKPTDLSSGKWIFLLILLVLIFEQAMAVRLSYHRKPEDLEAFAPSAAAAMAGRTTAPAEAEAAEGPAA
ncbi:MAG TPA: BatA domain-containing protein [Gemmata sp.]|nr:BatA domain-containing protein [Gemmata sp.]